MLYHAESQSPDSLQGRLALIIVKRVIRLLTENFALREKGYYKKKENNRWDVSDVSKELKKLWYTGKLFLTVVAGSLLRIPERLTRIWRELEI